MTSQHLTPRQAGWASLLSMYNFEILHTPGKLNPANPASCRPDFVAGKHTDGKVVLMGLRSLGADDKEICALYLTPATSISSDHSFMPVEDLTLHFLRQLYDSDATIAAGPNYLLRLESYLWWWRDRLYVPSSFQQFNISKFHGDPASDHWGVFCTLALLTRSFAWPNIQANVLSYVSSCARCQHISVNHQKPQGELVLLPISDRP